MIECRNIRKIYQHGGKNETLALQNISFIIQDGEFVAIMGPSGSGKSTLMHILGALDVPTDGRYILDGSDVSKCSEDELSEIRNRKIGFVFQSFNLLPRTDVFRNVMLPLVYTETPKSERDDKVRSALQSVNLEEARWYHKSNELSGGQIQRVAIARALVNDPSLILADEPTGNLDTKTGHAVLDTFRRINKERGHTVILITHELDIAERADRILFIRDGMIVEDRKTKNTYVRE